MANRCRPASQGERLASRGRRGPGSAAGSGRREPPRCVSAVVWHGSFPALFGGPRTREIVLAQMGQTLRRLHDLVVPARLAG